jgi:hypothetical protein
MEKKVIGIRLNPSGKREFSLGVVVTYTGRSADYIRRLHRAGKIPPPFRQDRWRWYTENQIHVLRKAFESLTPRQRDISEALDYIRAHWEDDYGEYESRSKEDQE